MSELLHTPDLPSGTDKLDFHTNSELPVYLVLQILNYTVSDKTSRQLIFVSTFVKIQQILMQFSL